VDNLRLVKCYCPKDCPRVYYLGFKYHINTSNIKGSTMVDMSAIVSVVASLNSVVQIAKAMEDVHNANVVQTKVFELTSEISLGTKVVVLPCSSSARQEG
jgi:hypothetical protein